MLRTITTLYATDEVPLAEKQIHAHYFVGGCDWYVAELDPRPVLPSDTPISGCGDCGYFSLVEKEGILAHGGWPVEREPDFQITTAKELGIA